MTSVCAKMGIFAPRGMVPTKKECFQRVGLGGFNSNRYSERKEAPGEVAHNGIQQSIIMGKTVTTYLIDGDPRGTRYAFISNKICQMFVVPRSNLSYLNEQERLQKPAF